MQIYAIEYIDLVINKCYMSAYKVYLMINQMSRAIEKDNQHCKEELPSGNSLETGLATLARMIARHLLACAISDRNEELKEASEHGSVAKVARGSRSTRIKNVPNGN
jgi:hypothetical protein